ATPCSRCESGRKEDETAQLKTKRQKERHVKFNHPFVDTQKRSDTFGARGHGLRRRRPLKRFAIGVDSGFKLAAVRAALFAFGVARLDVISERLFCELGFLVRRFSAGDLAGLIAARPGD